MIEAPRMAEHQEPPAPDDPRWEQMHCARCGGKLPRFILVPGTFVEDRCHHSVRGPDGKSRTCGYQTRTGPTR